MPVLCSDLLRLDCLILIFLDLMLRLYHTPHSNPWIGLLGLVIVLQMAGRVDEKNLASNWFHRLGL